MAKCKDPDFYSTNIILNLADKLDYLADKYRNDQTTDALIDFIHYRTECIKMICCMLFGGVYPFDQVYNMQVYISIVSDELNIFDPELGKSVSQPEFVEKIKKWRSRLNR